MNDAIAEQGAAADHVPCPVVAIGASAGGLEACSELLSHLRAPTGMAFVVIQHLDPTHASHLVDLLAKVSPLPVCEARDGQGVLADHVYVIAPDTSLELRDGVLRAGPRPPGPFMPVDLFLHSLAAAQGSRAVAVILSGTGTDGTLGVRAIRQRGGISFAQDDSAKHVGMPDSAIASDAIDFIRAPAEIAAALSRLALSAEAREEAAPLSEADEALLQRIFELLLNVSSVAYAKYKRATVLRRLQRRMSVLHMQGLTNYVAYIEQHPNELVELHQDLLIHVTRFFRDPAMFDVLTMTAIPKLLGKHTAAEPIRVWVPGCSTGEEVYSLAICLLEGLKASPYAPAVKIFATDVSAQALDTARAGRYPESISADVSAARLRDWFIKTDDGYQISKPVRDLCVFARHDMTSDPPFSNLDLISCRNVLIYLGAELQRRILPIFHYALKEHGLLLLGGAESVGSQTDLFVALDSRQRIFERKPGARRPMPGYVLSHANAGASGVTYSPPGSRPGVSGLQLEADRTLLSRYAPPGVLVSGDMEVLQSHGDVAPFLTLAPGIASLNLLKMARAGLALELRAAVDECRQTGLPARRAGIRLQHHAAPVDVQVLPVGAGSDRCYSVLFETAALAGAEGGMQVEAAEAAQAAAQDVTPASELAVLRIELADTRAYLQSVVEQLESGNEELSASNEEVLSTNEELQSTNEELQTAKEELQATNEELSTVNDELHHRIRQAVLLGNDLSNLFRNVAVPIVMVGQDMEVRRFTPAAADLFNLIPGDIGRPITVLKSHLVGDDLQQRVSAVLESLIPSEHEVLDDAGSTHLMCIRPYRTQDNRIDGAVISVTNVDAMKRVEAAMRESRDYAEDILSTVDVPLLVLDERQRVLSTNKAFHECFGTSAADVADRSLDELDAWPWNTVELPQRLRAVLATESTLERLEVKEHAAGRAPRTLRVSARRLPRRDGQRSRLLVEIEDITSQRLLEEQLRQSQKIEAVGHLAAGIAHDFNNLLTVINGYSALLKQRLGADAKAVSMVNTIGEAGERAAAITGQLLAFSRKSMVMPTVIDLKKYLADSLLMLTRLMGEHIRLSVAPAPDLGRVVMDPTLLSQILLNLAINARDAMPDGGELRIEAGNIECSGPAEPPCPGDMPAGSYVELKIMDSGVGMDAAVVERIFEPFFTTKEVGKGTGLGLASVYGSVKQSGGYIYVESQPGQGTTFRICLPRSHADTAMVSAVDGAPPLMPTGQEVLLLVEDELEVRRLAHSVLAEAGYTVLEADDGAAALALARAHPGTIDLLVTDVVMPNMGGSELARHLQAERPGLRVLFVSGYNDQALERSGLNLATAALLVKPYSPSALTQRVRTLLDQLA